RSTRESGHRAPPTPDVPRPSPAPSSGERGPVTRASDPPHFRGEISVVGMSVVREESGPVPEAVIAANDLVKTYRAKGKPDFLAVDGLTFGVAPGESFGLLGPDGAGKSTTMRMIGAVSTRTSGELSILGLDPDQYGPEIRSRLGVVPQQ